MRKGDSLSLLGRLPGEEAFLNMAYNGQSALALGQGGNISRAEH